MSRNSNSHIIPLVIEYQYSTFEVCNGFHPFSFYVGYVI